MHSHSLGPLSKIETGGRIHQLDCLRKLPRHTRSSISLIVDGQLSTVNYLQIKMPCPRLRNFSERWSPSSFGFQRSRRLFGHACQLARRARVTMSESVVDEDGLATSPKHDVRVLGPQAVAIAHRVKQLADRYLGLRVAAAHPSHSLASRTGVNMSAIRIRTFLSSLPLRSVCGEGCSQMVEEQPYAARVAQILVHGHPHFVTELHRLRQHPHQFRLAGRES